MELLTAEQIAACCNQVSNPRSNRTAINRIYLNQDESHLWPIRSRFNLTKRSIKKAQKHMNDCGEGRTGIAYCYLLESIMSEIVNNSRNW